MNLRFTSHFQALFLALFVLGFSTALAKDYRASDRRAKTNLSYLEQDHTLRRALSLGRGTGSLSMEDVEKIHKALEQKKPVPAELANTWQKLLRVSQAQSYFQSQKYFFPVGYEFETIHAGHSSTEEFEQGSKKFQKLLEGSVGLKSARTFNESAVMRDASGREWKLVTEYVRPTEEVAGGYEFVSPPMRDAGELQDVGTLAWRLGEKKFGKSNSMTGAHQTFTIVPNGETADAKLMGRMVANLQLLEAQYSPALYDLLDIRRYGSDPEKAGPLNFFMRPIVLDHQELLEDLKKIDPNTADLAQVRSLFFDKHVEKEFQRMLKVRLDQEVITKQEYEQLLKTPQSEQGNLAKLWKYRDMQIKYNLENPAKTLMETRIGDWVANRPEQTMLKTMLYQMLIEKSWELSKEGKIFQPDIPARLPNESDKAYWERLKNNPSASRESFLKTMGVTDPDKANMIMGKAFTVKEPGFRASTKPSYGFEFEGWGDELVDLIVPNDPKLYREWDSLSRNKKLNTLNEMGIELGEYTTQSSLRLGTEFRVNTAKYPFMSPDIIIEDSGNWEIMSNGRNLHDKETLEANIKKIARVIGKDGFGLHIHRFTPDSGLEKVKANPKAFSKSMERQSLSMALDAYAEASSTQPSHGIDSWSLDRYSPKEIEKIEKHLSANADISTAELKGLKYHNIAYRPVQGGLDIEVRDIGDDVEFGLKQVDSVSNAIDLGQFGKNGAEKSPPLFMEFRDHENPFSPETKKYTLLDAVEKRHPLTAQQKDLLRKFQFEIYKPSMSNFMYFVNEDTPSSPYWDHNEIPAKYLDPKMARANFENNVALPLLDYESQNYLTAQEKAKLIKGREEFADRIFAVLQSVEKDPRYKFLNEDNNFLYLCDYLQRSEHPEAKSIPFKKVSAKEAARRQELLEALTYRIRGEVVRSVKATEVHNMIRDSLPNGKKIPSIPTSNACMEGFKSLTL